VLLGRLERWTAWVAFVAFAASAIGLSVAGLIARRLAGSIRALIEPARALGEGRPVRVPGFTFREVASVAAALQAASALLHDRTLERDSAKRTSELLRRDAAHFEHAAHHDPLTGLPNRTHFLALLDETLRRHEGTGTPFTVLFLDLDDFKPVNDTHGHAVGDELLKAVAGRLAVAVRERDTVARLGGDEFALLIEGHSPTDAAHIARGLVERLSRPYTIGGLTLRISASVGAAGWPDDGLTCTELISAADTEMYRAKAGGKGGFSASGQMPL
jgi:diguanylate cyclase (GGDEF)-like protein